MEALLIKFERVACAISRDHLDYILIKNLAVLFLYPGKLSKDVFQSNKLMFDGKTSSQASIQAVAWFLFQVHSEKEQKVEIQE